MKYNELFIAKKISHHKVIGKKEKDISPQGNQKQVQFQVHDLYLYIWLHKHTIYIYIYIYICIKNPGNNDNLCV